MKKLIFTMGLIIFVLSAGFVQAQTMQSTPQEQVQDAGNRKAGQTIIHVKESSPVQAFYVNVTLDHENHIYEEGDEITITVESNKSGYLYLFYKDSAGNVSILFPNKYCQDNQIEANKRLLIPNYGKEVKITTTAPFGKDVIQAVVTTNPIDLQPIINFQDNKSIHQSSRTGLDVVEKKFNQERAPENYIAEYATTITTVPKGQVPQTQRKRVFVGICVAKCAHPRIAGQPHREKDLSEMASFFIESGAVDPDNSLTLVNEEVTKERLRYLFFNYLPNHTNPGDEVIIYWTGINGRCEDVDGDEGVDEFDNGYSRISDGRRVFDETLFLYDTDQSDPNTMLIDDEFGRWAMNLQGRKVLFIFEGGYCFGMNELVLLSNLGVTNFAIVASGALPFSIPLVQEEQQMSVMTWYMADCLKNNRRISHMELYNKVRPQVYDYRRKPVESRQNMSIFDNLDSPMILNP